VRRKLIKGLPVKEYYRQYRQKNKKHLKEYNQRPEVKKRVRKQSSEWYNKNKHRYRHFFDMHIPKEDIQILKRQLPQLYAKVAKKLLKKAFKR